MPDSRSRTWVRWLGWTVVFALVAWASGVASVRSAGGIPRALHLIFLVPPLAAAFLIGTRFPSWWVAGPLVVMFVFSLVGSPLLLTLYLPAGALLLESMRSTEALIVVFLVVVILLLVLHALAAAAGVWRGQTR